jgi:hypothetical protein
MYKHVGTAAGWVGAECDRETAITQIGLAIAGQRQGCGRPAGGRDVQCQAGETGRALAINPGDRNPAA